MTKFPHFESVDIFRSSCGWPKFVLNGETRFVGEETYKAGAALTDKPTFIVDPIDGTTNFIHTLPVVCVSIGVCVNKKPVAGVVHNPFTGVLWSAVRGHGAYVRSTEATCLAGLSTTPQRLPLRPTLPPLNTLQDALVAVEWGSDRDGPHWDARVKLFSKLGGSKRIGGGMVHGFRSSGSAALNFCAVASGQLDVAWEAGAWAWDVCAAWAILEEAGGRVVDANPKRKARTWEEKAPNLEGRTFLGVRATNSEMEQERVVEELWCLVDSDFTYD